MSMNKMQFKNDKQKNGSEKNDKDESEDDGKKEEEDKGNDRLGLHEDKRKKVNKVDNKEEEKFVLNVNERVQDEERIDREDEMKGKSGKSEENKKNSRDEKRNDDKISLDEKRKVVKSQENSLSNDTDKVHFLDLIGMIQMVMQYDTSILIKFPYFHFTDQRFEEILEIGSGIAPMFKVMIFGDDRKVYFLRNFFKNRSFDSFEGFLETLLVIFSELFHEGLKIPSAEETLVIDDVRCRNPDSLGFPYSQLEQVYAESLNNLSLWLRTIFKKEPYSKPVNRVKVLADSASLIIRKYFSEKVFYGNHEMRDIIDNYFRRFVIFGRPVRRIRENTLYEYANYIYNFRYVTWVLEGLPDALRFSFDFVNNFISPEIGLNPISSGSLVRSGETNAFKQSFVQTIINVGFEEGMSEMIAAYIHSLLCPGYVEFDIDWGTITDDQRILRGMVACIAKLLFLYNRPRGGIPLDCMFNVTEEFVQQIEMSLLTWGLEENILGINRDHNLATFPLAQAVPRGRLEEFNLLVTNLGGRGWANGPFTTWRVDDGIHFYENHMNRPLYGIPVDDYVEYQESRTILQGRWEVARGLRDFVSKIRRGRGFVGVLECYIGRISDFFVRMNEYLKLNYYTGMRLSDHLMNQSIVKEKGERIRCVIDAKTIIFMGKSLPINYFERKIRVEEQLRAESALVRELIMLRVQYDMLYSYVMKYVMASEFTRSKLWKMVSERENGYLSRFLLYLESIGRLSLIPSSYGNNFNVLEVFQMMQVFVTKIKENLTFYGIVEEIYLDPTLLVFPDFLLREVAENSKVLSNVFVNIDDKPLVDITMDQIRLWILKSSFRKQLRNITILDKKVIVLHLPVSLDIGPIKKLEELSMVIDVGNYGLGKKINDILKFHELKVFLLSISLKDLETEDNIFTTTFNVLSSYISGGDYKKIFKSVDEFVSEVNTCVVDSFVIDSNVVRTFSLLG